MINAPKEIAGLSAILLPGWGDGSPIVIERLGTLQLRIGELISHEPSDIDVRTEGTGEVSYGAGDEQRHTGRTG